MDNFIRTLYDHRQSATISLLIIILLITQLSTLSGVAVLNLSSLALTRALTLPVSSPQRNKWLDVALSNAESAIRISPELNRAYLAAGRTQLEMGQTGVALQDLTLAVQLGASDEVSLWLLGNTLFGLGNYSEAVVQWSQAPHVIQKLLTEADGRAKSRDLEVAYQEYQMVVKVAQLQKNPAGEAAGYGGLGNVRSKQLRWNEAIENARLAAQAMPDDPVLLAELGHILDMAGQINEAFDVARRSLAMQPNGLAQLVLGELYYKQGDLSQAAVHFMSATDLEPTNPWGWYWLSVIFNKQGDKASAEKYWQRAADLDPAFAVPFKAPVTQ